MNINPGALPPIVILIVFSLIILVNYRKNASAEELARLSTRIGLVAYFGVVIAGVSLLAFGPTP